MAREGEPKEINQLAEAGNSVAESETEIAMGTPCEFHR